MCVGACVWSCVHEYALRIVSVHKILHSTNTLTTVITSHVQTGVSSHPGDVSEICTNVLVTDGRHVANVGKVLLHKLAVVNNVLGKQQLVGWRILQQAR